MISYKSQMLDWKTSQVLFANGWMETNARFTTTGRPNDLPMGYDAGARRIREQALETLQLSIVNNLVAGIGERLLAARYPAHRTLIRSLSWVERIAFASYVAYLRSADHFRQAGSNRELAQAYGY